MSSNGLLVRCLRDVLPIVESWNRGPTGNNVGVLFLPA